MQYQPQLQHFSFRDGKEVYSPSEDTYTLIDALAADVQRLRNADPLVCLEVGSGSGAVTAALAKMLGPSRLYLCVDVNAKAALMTQKTLELNDVRYGDVMRTDLLSGLRNCVDLLVCNPPYVVTSEDEYTEGQRNKDIVAAYAGGPRGRRLTDRLLADLHKCLRPGALWYLLQVAENCPGQLGATEVLRRTIRCETQVVVRSQLPYWCSQSSVLAFPRLRNV